MNANGDHSCIIFGTGNSEALFKCCFPDKLKNKEGGNFILFFLFFRFMSFYLKIINYTTGLREHVEFTWDRNHTLQISSHWNLSHTL